MIFCTFSFHTCVWSEGNKVKRLLSIIICPAANGNDDEDDEYNKFYGHYMFVRSQRCWDIKQVLESLIEFQ